MTVKNCTAVQRRLSALQDGELDIEERVAVQAHLHDCERCAGEARLVKNLGDLLRAGAAARVEAASEDLAGLSANVVSRLAAERSESLGGRVGRMFEDLHLVWAALGATGAAVACIAMITGLMSFGTPDVQPGSLRAQFLALASPGSNANPVNISSLMALPFIREDESLLTKLSSAATEEDLLVLMDAIVSKEGQVRNLKLLESNDQAARAETAAQQQAIRELSSAILNARLQPARNWNGLPLAVNVVWLHAHLTVRGKVPTEIRTPGRALSMLLPADPNPFAAA
jgi:Putative zinc-finger